MKLEIDFTEQEAVVIVDLAAKNSLPQEGVIRQALRLYQAAQLGVCEVVWRREIEGCPPGCPSPE